MGLQPKEQWGLLKGPLITTAVILVVLAGAAVGLHLLKPSKEPPILGAAAPAAGLRNLAFFKEDNEYVLYFSLVDQSGNEIARGGGVDLKISQLGTIGVEGMPQFVNETVLLDAHFDVGLNSYRWIDIGGAIFFNQRQLVIPKRIAPDLFKLPPRSGQLGQVSVTFRDAKVLDAQVYMKRRLLFP